MQCYVIYCINHKRALLEKYGVAEEIAEIKVNVPVSEGSRNRFDGEGESGNRFDGEGDVDVDGLCRAAFKLFNKQGLYDTLNEGRQKFYAWLVENHPKYVLGFLKNFSGSRMDISYEAAVPLLLMFPVYMEYLQQTADFSTNRLKSSIFSQLSCTHILGCVLARAIIFDKIIRDFRYLTNSTKYALDVHELSNSTNFRYLTNSTMRF